MATTILHVGEDLCRRIPVMETAGFVVFQSEVEIRALHTAFNREGDYSAVVFHNDIAAVPEDAVEETRSHSEAPLVLFQNPTVASNDEEFDLVIPALTSPNVWLQKLRDLIQASRETCERSRQLRQDCADVRAKSRSLRLKAAHTRILPIDPDALWRGNDSDGHPDSKLPKESRPDGFGENAGKQLRSGAGEG